MIFYKRLPILYNHSFDKNQQKMSKNGAFTSEDQITLDKLMKQIKQSYKQLKDCPDEPIQATIIWSLQPKCDQALKLLKKTSQKSEYIVKTKQITDIRNKIKQLDVKIKNGEANNPKIGNGGRIVKLQTDKNYTEEDLKAEIKEINQLKLQNEQNTKYQFNMGTKKEEHIEAAQGKVSRDSMRILSCIAMQQIKSANLKYTKQQLDEVLKRLKDNQEVINNIQQMIKSQGNNLDQVQKNIEKAYQNTQQMNKQLGHAEKQQLKAINKVRKAFQMTAKGIWGFISWPFKMMFKKKNTV